jgi:hypothetical protein
LSSRIPFLIRRTFVDIFAVLLALLGFGFGFYVGNCNTGGFLLALPPGLIAAAIFSYPMVRDKMWTEAGIVAVAALVGALLVTALPQTNYMRRLGQSFAPLTLNLGPYKFGRLP